MSRFITINQSFSDLCKHVQATYNVPDSSVFVFDESNIEDVSAGSHTITTDTGVSGTPYSIELDDSNKYSGGLLYVNLTNLNNYAAGSSYNDAITIILRLFVGSYTITPLYVIIRDDHKRSINILLKTSDMQYGCGEIHYFKNNDAVQIKNNGSGSVTCNFIHRGDFAKKHDELKFTTVSNVDYCKKSMLYLHSMNPVTRTSFHLPTSEIVDIPVGSNQIEVIVRDGQELSYIPATSAVSKVNVRGIAKVKDTDGLIVCEDKTTAWDSVNTAIDVNAFNFTISTSAGMPAVFERERYERVTVNSQISIANGYSTLDAAMIDSSTYVTSVATTDDTHLKKK